MCVCDAVVVCITYIFFVMTYIVHSATSQLTALCLSILRCAGVVLFATMDYFISTAFYD